MSPRRFFHPIPEKQQLSRTNSPIVPCLRTRWIVKVVLLFSSRVDEVVRLNPRQPHRIPGNTEAHSHIADDDCHRNAD